MAFGVNKLVRYLTKRHDKKNEKISSEIKPDGRLSDVERNPSPMLAFWSIENKTDEREIIRLLKKVFLQNENVKTQFGAAGENLLYCACKLGRLKVAKFLLENGLNPRQETSLGTVLHALLRAYTKKLISLAEFTEMTGDICTRGCDVDAVNHMKMSPFLCAVESGSVSAMNTFVNLGCDYSLKDSRDSYALHIACKTHAARVDVLKYLLSLPKSSPQVFNAEGQTPLFMVVKDYLHAVKSLPSESKLRRSGLSVSEEELMKNCMQYLSLVELLLKAGADTTLVSLDKGTDYLSHLLLIHRRVEMYSEGAISEPEFASNGDASDENIVTLLNMVPLTNQLICIVLIYGGMKSFTMDKFRRWSVRNYVPYEGSKIFEDPYINELLECLQERYRDLNERPLSLKVLCRSTIRVEVGRYGNLHMLEKLPLPKALIDYTGLKTIL